MVSPLIKLEKVNKTYQMGEVEVAALVDINLTVKKGEFVAVIGPSGSGKSTLMHIIGLLDRPTKGKVYLEGKDVSQLSNKECSILRNKRLGFVFQSFNLLPKTSALDNVSLPLLYSGVGHLERIKKSKKALQTVGLEGRMSHFPSQLSGGQQQKVAIARAFVNRPSLILADEPTGNLDSKSGREIMELLRRLNTNNHTIVLVTHELSIAKGTRRIIEIKDGQIIRDQFNEKK